MIRRFFLRWVFICHILLSVFGLFISCHVQQANVKNPSICVLDNNVARKGIFEGDSTKYNFSYLFTRADVRLGRFSCLENGFDSIAIRLWYIYSGPITQIIEIKKTARGWAADFYSIKRHLERDKKDTIVSIIAHRSLLQPKSGWTNFLQQMSRLGIVGMRDANDIPDYNFPNDGNSVVMEIATKNTYNFKYYSTPNAHGHIPEVNALEDFMALIEAEFGEKRLEVI